MPTNARLTILCSDEDNGVQGRLGDRYESGLDGKKILLDRCVTSGFMLKECGLQDIVLELDALPAYRNGTASQRRSLLLSEMSKLLGGAGLPVPPATHAPEQPISYVQATSEPAQTAAIKPTAPAQPVVPVTADNPETEQHNASRVPNLGRVVQSED